MNHSEAATMEILVVVAFPHLKTRNPNGHGSRMF